MTSLAIRKKSFLDLFNYERVEVTKEGKFYINCVFLKDHGTNKKGYVYDKVYMSLIITGYYGTNCYTDKNENI